MGCQRSGTTLISNVLDTPKDTRVYGEFSPLSDQDPAKIRLNTTENILCRFNSSYYLLKCTLFNKVKLNNVIERNYEKKYLKNIQRNCSINR